MKIEEVMQAYQHGERAPVSGPLDYLQALALLQMNRKLRAALRDVIDARTPDENGQPRPLPTQAKAHYLACSVLAEAELL